MDNEQLRQAVESLHASCSLLSEIMPSVGICILRTNDRLDVFATLTTVEDINKIPTVPTVKDEGYGGYRYRVSKRFAGIEFSHYCSATELVGLLKPQVEEVAASATD